MTMLDRSHTWKPLRHPLNLAVRKGWVWGRRCVISPRGTVFETRHSPVGVLARKRADFQLINN